MLPMVKQKMKVVNYVVTTKKVIASLQKNGHTKKIKKSLTS